MSDDKGTLGPQAGAYYSNPEVLAWYNNIHGIDYVGVGMWPAEIVEKDGVHRGFGFDECWKSLKVRDDLFLEHILNQVDENPKKLKCIDIGGGRGGLARNTALGLKAIDRLDHMTCLNISPEENVINAARQKEQGLTDKEYSIEMADFESLDYKESNSIDVVLSSDALMYCVDREKMMDQMARVVTKNGVIVFTDYLQHPEAKPEDVKEVCDRLKSLAFGTLDGYAGRLRANGLKQILAEESTDNIIRHYGFIHHCAATLKKEKLLAAGCTPEFLEIQKTGMRKWVETGLNKVCSWGWFVFKKVK